MARVLFLEDSHEWQETVQDLLQTAGHVAKGAVSFEIAIDLLGGPEPFDVIVLDLRLGAEKSEPQDPFLWLEALVNGLSSRKLRIPPIIIVTGIAVEKQHLVQAFTEFRPHVVNFLEKQDFDRKIFLRTVGDAASLAPRETRIGASPAHVLLVSLILAGTVFGIFAGLLWCIRQISDPKTQQTFLTVGGSLIVIMFLLVLAVVQRTKLEDLLSAVAKIWKR